MGFRIEMGNATSAVGTVAPSDRRPAGNSSIRPESTIRDLRHPNPVRPVLSNSTQHQSVLLPARVEVEWSTGRTVEFLAARLSQAAAHDQRIDVVEDRRDG